MKKSILLAVLPALMVLSACSAGPKSNNKNIMIEDTNAHEEIFGSLVDSELQPIKLQPNKALEEGTSFYKPTIGFQRKENNDGTYSIRFVSAMQSGTDSAKWYRSVHNLGGVCYTNKSKAFFDVEKVYSSLNNGGNPAFATSEKAEDDSYPYDCYAVYCLLNIPATGLDGYYVDAYLEVKNGSETLVSTVGSLNIYDTSKQMKYELGDRNRNIAEINGVLTETDTLKDGNHFNIYSLSLSANQAIRWWYIDKDALTYALCTDFSLGRDNPDFEMGSNGELIAKHKGTYNIFLNESNKFYFEKKIYFQAPDWWENDNTAAWVQLNYNGGNDYEAMIPNEYAHQYYVFCDISYYNWIKFYRASGLNQYNPSGEKGFPSDGKCLFNYSEDTWYNV